MNTLPAQDSAVSDSLAKSLNGAFSSVYEKVAPSVVIIEVGKAPGRQLSGLPEGLQFFWQGPAPKSLESEQGSGIIISSQGHILTNFHVVDEAVAGQIKVSLKDGRKLDAEIVGIDPSTDLAVLKIDGQGLPAADLGDSDTVKVGQFAFALGAPFDLPYTFTVGIVSAKGRGDLETGSGSIAEYIQTDASINPGNSGGPLCDIDGKVIGINTMIAGMNRGLGFALPINTAKDVASQLISTGKVARSWLGIVITGVDEDDRAKAYFPNLSGVLVDEIGPNTPAYGSDLRAGDVITKVDGVPVAKARELRREILNKKVGQEVKLDLVRGGQEMVVAVKTGEQPSRMIQASNRISPQITVLPDPVPPGIPPSVLNPQPDEQTPVRPPAPRKKEIKPQPENLHGMVLSDAGGRMGRSGGALVKDVVEDSSAATAGLLSGDIITEAAGKPVHGAGELSSILSQADMSRGVMMMVERRNQQTFVILKP
ncbi:serine protease Do [Terrimicrobium sacchariphilum]|uniref:Serine protease Do n=1 Tax=Terrimicrobium sacchariphilum TaxID=690879 RepID=A0A146G811_TERSA|nr:trypsin-like peptidase domain-containing protein [Terrimicrobium sacchariphilum]GAT33839.1 serine protease Do [Terrimicrobium sacchariphilum]